MKMIFSTYYCERVEPFSACMNIHIYYILSSNKGIFV